VDVIDLNLIVKEVRDVNTATSGVDGDASRRVLEDFEKRRCDVFAVEAGIDDRTIGDVAEPQAAGRIHRRSAGPRGIRNERSHVIEMVRTLNDRIRIVCQYETPTTLLAIVMLKLVVSITRLVPASATLAMFGYRPGP
jgi:hypothetical protein